MIDYSILDLKDEFTLEQAAYFWLEMDSNNKNSLISEYFILIDLLTSDANNNLLNATISNFSSVEKNKTEFQIKLEEYSSLENKRSEYKIELMVKRVDLKSWAEQKGHKPKFLFPEMRQIESSVPANQQADIQDKWSSKNERVYLLRTIGSLSLLLIEKTQSEKFGTREKPNKSAIYSEIQQLLFDMGFSEEGQGKTILNDVLKEALDTAMKNNTSNSGGI